MKRRVWLEDVGLLGLLTGLTAVWLGLWLDWLRRWLLPLQPLPWHLPYDLALLLLSSALLTRWAAQQGGLGLKRTRAVVVCLGAFAASSLAWLVTPQPAPTRAWSNWINLSTLLAAALPAFLAAGYMWWQGIRLGRRALGYQTLARAFYVGVLALAVLFAANCAAPVYTSADVLGPVLLFFGLSLLGLTLVSLRRLGLHHRAPLQRSTLERQWRHLTFTVVGLVLAAGWLAARWIAPESVDRLNHGLRLVSYWLSSIMRALLVPAALFLAQVLEPFRPILRGAAYALLAAFDRLLGFARGLLLWLHRLFAIPLPRLFEPKQWEQLITAPAVQASGRWLIIILVLMATGLLFWLAARGLRALPAGSEDEVRESILTRQLLWAQLRELFRRRRRRLSVAPFLPLTGTDEDSRLVVRRAYQAMLEWAWDHRVPRAAGQTPSVYAKILIEAMPQAQEPILVLTRAYMQARYAPDAPSLPVARRAEGAVLDLRRLAPMEGKRRRPTELRNKGDL